MRKLACFTMLAICGAASGEDLLDCIEPDVLHGLVLQGQGATPVITSAVPAELAALRMPAGFSWIGSAERAAGRIDVTTPLLQVTAAWRSSLAPSAAREAAVSAMTAAGWEVQPRLGFMRAVFNSPAFDTRTACREGATVTINAQRMDGVTYVMLNVQRGNAMTACNQPARAAPFAGNQAMESILPSLELPLDPRRGVPMTAGSNGMSTSGSAVSARTEIITTESAASVARHFATQMAEQGWTSDANWNGAATAGSSWSRRGQDGNLVQATLMVMAAGEGRIRATLRLGKL